MNLPKNVTPPKNMTQPKNVTPPNNMTQSKTEGQMDEWMGGCMDKWTVG